VRSAPHRGYFLWDLGQFPRTFSKSGDDVLRPVFLKSVSDCSEVSFRMFWRQLPKVATSVPKASDV
jgi:hypothetical protein